MEQRGRELDSWEEMIEKAVDAEAKAGLQPTSFIREMDHRCQRGNRPAHVTAAKVQTLGSKNLSLRPRSPSLQTIPRKAKRLGRRRKRGDKRRNARGKTPILVPPLPEPMRPTPMEQGLKALRKTSLESFATTATKRVITLETAPSPGRKTQKIVGMQACGDVMIGHGRSVHEAIPHICGAKAIPTSLLLSSSLPRNN